MWHAFRISEACDTVSDLQLVSLLLMLTHRILQLIIHHICTSSLTVSLPTNNLMLNDIILAEGSQAETSA